MGGEVGECCSYTSSDVILSLSDVLNTIALELSV